MKITGISLASHSSCLSKKGRYLHSCRTKDTDLELERRKKSIIAKKIVAKLVVTRPVFLSNKDYRKLKERNSGRKVYTT
jgi:hypothetical protein